MKTALRMPSFQIVLLFVQAEHDDVIKWKHFPRHWPLWGESTGDQFLQLIRRLETPAYFLPKHNSFIII